MHRSRWHLSIPVGERRRRVVRRIRGTGFMECDAETGGSICLDACELHHLAPLLGFLGDEFAEVGGRAPSTVPPRSASRAFMLGSARAALISLLSLSTISADVFLGTPMPCQVLAS